MAQRNLRALRNVFPVGMKILQQISIREKLSSLIIASSAFLLMGNDDSTLEQSIFHTYDGRECMGLSNSQCRSTADWPVFWNSGTSLCN